MKCLSVNSKPHIYTELLIYLSNFWSTFLAWTHKSWSAVKDIAFEEVAGQYEKDDYQQLHYFKLQSLPCCLHVHQNVLIKSKLENIQKQAPRFVRNDFVSSYKELLTKCGPEKVTLETFRYTTMEVFKCVNNKNPKSQNEIFTLKNWSCDIRDNSILERPTVFQNLCS